MQKTVIVYDNENNVIDRINHPNVARCEVKVVVTNLDSDLPEVIKIRGQELTRKQFIAVIKMVYYSDNSDDNKDTLDFVYQNTPDGFDRNDAVIILDLARNYNTYSY